MTPTRRISSRAGADLDLMSDRLESDAFVFPHMNDRHAITRVGFDPPSARAVLQTECKN